MEARTAAVVGSGCAGLAAAHALCKLGWRVTVFEADEHVGGHAHTRSVEGTPVDVGFMVCNRVTYPNMVRAGHLRRAMRRRARVQHIKCNVEGQATWRPVGGFASRGGAPRALHVRLHVVYARSRASACVV